MSSLCPWLPVSECQLPGMYRRPLSGFCIIFTSSFVSSRNLLVTDPEPLPKSPVPKPDVTFTLVPAVLDLPRM